MTLPKDFAALILTHGRPDRVLTLQALKRAGYTGRWYLVVDDQDPTRGKYITQFGAERVLTFSKAEVAEAMDLADAGGSNACVVFARNACDGLAASLGLARYIQLDDDYTYFARKHGDGLVLRQTFIRHLDDVLNALMEFQDASGALTVCLAQTGDFLGGVDDQFYRNGLARKAMNTFICRTGHPVNFLGRINEDVSAYVVHGGRGALLFTVTNVLIHQTQTQLASGGMSDAYSGGTYMKSMYTVMMRPDAVKVRSMGPAGRRLHHQISWNHAVPKILSSRHQRTE